MISRQGVDGLQRMVESVSVFVSLLLLLKLAFAVSNDVTGVEERVRRGAASRIARRSL